LERPLLNKALVESIDIEDHCLIVGDEVPLIAPTLLPGACKNFSYEMRAQCDSLSTSRRSPEDYQAKPTMM
jgi:hypothetical protein